MRLHCNSRRNRPPYFFEHDRPHTRREAFGALPHYRRGMTSPRTSVITAWKQASSRQAPLLAAGVAFYAFLSLFPAMIAAVMTYGLVASPETVAKQSQDVADALPSDAASVVTGQMDSLTQ